MIKPLKKQFRYWVEYAVFRFFVFLVRFLSAKVLCRLGNQFGRLWYLLGQRRRKVVEVNLDIAFKDTKSHLEKKMIALRSFQVLATSILQCLWLFSDPQNKIKLLIEKEPEGLEIVKSCLERKKVSLRF